MTAVNYEHVEPRGKPRPTRTTGELGVISFCQRVDQRSLMSSLDTYNDLPKIDKKKNKNISHTDT